MILPPQLDAVWNHATQAEKDEAKQTATRLIEGLVHYRRGGNWYDDDVITLAAALLYAVVREANKNAPTG